MIKINQAVIVEGRYDKIKLSNIIDAVIIETNGFQIFKDKEKLNMIRNIALTKGIIILTDSDSAGFKIRNYLISCINIKDKNLVKNIFIPDILGKEKRKISQSKEGKLGVEGIDDNILINILKKAGVEADRSVLDGPAEDVVTKMDLYEDGLTGSDDSTEKRKILLKYMNLPELMTTNRMLEMINIFMTKKEYKDTIRKLFEDQI